MQQQRASRICKACMAFAGIEFLLELCSSSVVAVAFAFACSVLRDCMAAAGERERRLCECASQEQSCVLSVRPRVADGQAAVAM
eukprot:11404-Heterococcus_DN1.PRE.2